MTLNLNASYSFESNSFFTAANEAQVSTGGWHRLDARAGARIQQRARGLSSTAATSPTTDTS